MYTEQMYENSLCHYGVKGQKWGERRFQNLDGTYTALGERRRLETLARTGTTVRPTSALANRQTQARTGNVVRVNSVNRTTTSKPMSRPVTTSTGASKVVLDKATGTVKRVSTATTGSPAAKRTTVSVTKPTAKLVSSEESKKAKAKLSKASTETTDDEEETKTTKKKASTKKKSTKKKTQAQKEAEQKAKEAEEQKTEEEKKDETQNEGPLTSEQLQDYARRVIRGEFGNGQERRDKLGDKYAQVQALVNSILLKGRKK